MTKTIKMSLAAAMAVAAFSSTASAGSLEEAIKGVSIKGKVNVEYETHSVSDEYNDDFFGTNGNRDGDEASQNEWEYDIDLTATIPVNDIITAEVGFQADHESEARNDNTDAGSGDEHVNVTKLNFTAKLPFATVKVGKQGQPTPFLHDERGDGIVALVPAGPVTLAAGHFNGMNGGQDGGQFAVGTLVTNGNGTINPALASGGTWNGLDTAVGLGTNGLINLNLSERDITAAAVIGAFGPINMQVWYASLSNASSGSTDTDDVINNVNTGWTEDGGAAYALMLGGKFGPAQIDFMHASAKLKGINDSNFDAEKMTTLTAGFDLGVVNLTAGYGMTNDANHDFDTTKDTDDDAVGMNARLHGTDLTADGDAKTNMAMEIARLDELNDADAFLLGVSSTFGKFTVGASYFTADSKFQLVTDLNTSTAAVTGASAKVDMDVQEIDLTVNYAMSKNFSIEAVYAMIDAKHKLHSTNTAEGDGRTYESTSYTTSDDALAVRMTYKF